MTGAAEPSARFDHLVVAGTDLGALVAWWRRETGTEPVTGGPHDGLGTRNALVTLDDGYLELIAPDPTQPEPAAPRPFGIDDLPEHSIRLVTFACAVDDLDGTVAALRGVGVEMTPPRAMQRTRPDGVTLAWRLALPVASPGGIVPFLIDWGDTPHPADGPSSGCRIERLRAVHPDPAAVSPALELLGVAIDIEEGRSPGLGAELAHPLGTLVL